MYNHFQLQDGVNRAAMAIANEMAKRNDVEITLIPLFEFDKECFKHLDTKVVVKKGLGFYFRGLGRIVEKMVPPSLFYKWLVKGQYDVNIAFQCGISQRIIASGVGTGHDSIAWMHGYDEGLVYREEYERMGKVVCVSRYNAERLSREIGNTVEVDYSYNPTNDEKIRLEGLSPIDISRPNRFLFVAVGRLSPEKGFSRLLDCAHKLKSDGYDFSLWLIGDGPLRPSLQEQISNHGLGDNVILLGFKSNPHAYTSKADVLVCSSFSEGYSTVCAEAIMLGVPVITTRISGAEEIITDAKCGLVFPSDTDSLYDAMKYCVLFPEKVSEWKHILEETKYNFSPKERIKRFVKIIGLNNE